LSGKKKVARNLGSDESSAFWRAVKEDALAVRALAEWKRAGISDSDVAVSPPETKMAKNKSTKTKKRSLAKKPEDGVELMLEGKVFIVEALNGEVTKTELDGELVLRCVVDVLRRALDYKSA
jgi:hypothetical protein